MTKKEVVAGDEWSGAEEVKSNWFKFEKVGDKIKVTLLKRSVQPGSEGFSDQLICELRTADGSVWNVGVTTKKTGNIGRLNNCKVGELIGIIFDSKTEPSKKGFHPAKNLKIVTFGMDPNYNEMDGGEEVDGGADPADEM